jgi:Antibiotic biosynthesis monooxygenase
VRRLSSSHSSLSHMRQHGPKSRHLDSPLCESKVSLAGGPGLLKEWLTIPRATVPSPLMHREVFTWSLKDQAHLEVALYTDARVVTIHVRLEKMDECLRIFKEVNGPSIAGQPGFDHGHWWVDRTTGKAMSVTFWETEANERASRANIPRLIEGMAHVLASHDVQQESFEAVHEPQKTT